MRWRKICSAKSNKVASYVFYYVDYPSYFIAKSFLFNGLVLFVYQLATRNFFFLQCKFPFLFLQMPLGKIQIRSAWVARLSPGPSKLPESASHYHIPSESSRRHTGFTLLSTDVFGLPVQAYMDLPATGSTCTFMSSPSKLTRKLSPFR